MHLCLCLENLLGQSHGIYLLNSTNLQVSKLELKSYAQHVSEIVHALVARARHVHETRHVSVVDLQPCAVCDQDWSLKT